MKNMLCKILFQKSQRELDKNMTKSETKQQSWLAVVFYYIHI